MLMMGHYPRVVRRREPRLLITENRVGREQCIDDLVKIWLLKKAKEVIVVLHRHANCIVGSERALRKKCPLGTIGGLYRFSRSLHKRAGKRIFKDGDTGA